MRPAAEIEAVRVLTALRGDVPAGPAQRADRAGRCCFLNGAARSARWSCQSGFRCLRLARPHGPAGTSPRRASRGGGTTNLFFARGRGARSGLADSPTRARNALWVYCLRGKMRLGACVRLFGGMLLRETPGLQLAPVQLILSRFLYGAARPAPLGGPTRVGAARSWPAKRFPTKHAPEEPCLGSGTSNSFSQGPRGALGAN